MELNLNDKRVLITGSSRGIGLELARTYLSEGAKVVLTSRNQEDLDQLGHDLSLNFGSSVVLALACDFTQPEQISKLKAQITAAWNGLDILVLNVGSGKSVPDPIPAAENFNQVLQLNLYSAINTAREFYQLLAEAQGNMLLIASIAGVEAIGAPVDYAVAKSALIAFAKNLARKAANDGIRVNCLAPGNVYFSGGTWAQKAQADPEGVSRYLQAAVPMRRFGRPEEIAAAAVFLSSERAAFVTGACLVIDGGQTASF